MVRIQHTRDTDATLIFGREFFFEDTNVIDVPLDEARYAVEKYDELEFVVDIPDDYDTLRAYAAMADTEAVNGNSTKEELAEWFDSLSADRRAALRGDAE